MKHRLTLDLIPRYRALGLKDNPFPGSGTVEGIPQLYYNQKRAVRTLSQLLSSSISNRKSANIVVIGTYGSGKSHTLRYVQASVATLQRKDKTGPMCVFVSQPGRTPTEFARQVFLDIGIERLSNLARSFVASNGAEPPGGTEDGWESVEDGSILLVDAVRKSIPLLTDLTQFPDFSRAFVNLCSLDSQFEAWSWICGERLESRFRRRLGLTANLSDHDALRAIVAAVRILHSQGVSPMILLLDEFETIETLSIRQKQELLFNLRWLMDQCPRGLVLILACAPEIWAEIAAQYHAFSARIGAQVELRPLRLREVRELTRRYLLASRVDRKNRPVMSDSFLRRVFQVSEGNIRRILMLCHDGIEAAALSGCEIVEERHLPTWAD